MNSWKVTSIEHINLQEDNGDYKLSTGRKTSLKIKHLYLSKIVRSLTKDKQEHSIWVLQNLKRIEMLAENINSMEQ